MFKRIIKELVLIRKELQAIKVDLELNRKISVNPQELGRAVRQATRDSV